MEATGVFRDKLDISCDRCHDPEVRETWGCDHATAEPVFEIECLLCDGSGCDGCDDGVMAFHRCPRATLREADPEGRLTDAIRAYRQQQQGRYPRDGGYLDMPAGYIESLDVIDREIERVKESKRPKRRGRRRRGR